MKVLTLILAGGLGRSLGALTQQRSKPAVPIAGKYRLIDFPLSNAVNSKLKSIAVLAQFHAFSLVEYLGTGGPWGLDETAGGSLQIWPPYRGRTELASYLGTANAVYQNRDYILETGCEMVLILAGDHICRQDYRELIAFHQEKEASLTLSTLEVPRADAHRFGVMDVDEQGKIRGFHEKVDDPPSTLASMGIYVFNTAFLLGLLENDARNPESRHDFGADIIPQVVGRGRAYAYPFHGYWRDVGSLEAYWRCNMDLLGPAPAFRLNDPAWAIRTPPAEPWPPAQVAAARDSLISEGVEARGGVEHSVLSPGVVVEEGAVVRDSVLLERVTIRAGAVVERCVIDQDSEVSAGARLGAEDAPETGAPVFSGGVTLVGRQAVIPPAAVVGRGMLVEGGGSSDIP